jgi:hypothetical protein
MCPEGLHQSRMWPGMALSVLVRLLPFPTTSPSCLLWQLYYIIFKIPSSWDCKLISTLA